MPMLLIRSATTADLDAINRIIAAAIMTWDLPERVKHLILPSYKYNVMDLQHMSVVVAVQQDTLCGVAAWEPAKQLDAPKDKTALLLHGIYIDPAYFRQGIGSELFQAAEQAARQLQLDGIVVKAQKGSEPFYTAMGLQKLAVADSLRGFENRYWKESLPLC